MAQRLSSGQQLFHHGATLQCFSTMHFHIRQEAADGGPRVDRVLEGRRDFDPRRRAVPVMVCVAPGAHAVLKWMDHASNFFFKKNVHWVL
jgi:hypothetical protein